MAPSSPHFNFYSQTNEQDLAEDLMVESVEMYADDMIYVVRDLNAYDEILNEDAESTYTAAYEIPVYPDNPQGFTGQSSFLSQFGHEIRDEMTFIVTRRHFETEVTKHEPSILRPREGDLIFMPMHGRCFRVSYVDKYAVFFQFGRLTNWKVKCELIEINNEVFATGYPAIDALNEFSLRIPSSKINGGTANVNIENGGLVVSSDTSIIGSIDLTADNDAIKAKANTTIWSADDPFSEGRL